jgi:hypothetical protein
MSTYSPLTHSTSIEFQRPDCESFFGCLDGTEDLMSYADMLDIGDHQPHIHRNQVNRRERYGNGPDARRTAQFRGYDIVHSAVVCCLKERYGLANMRLLLQLAMRVVNDSSPPMKISPPSRAEKRSKRGLVRWLDQHSDSVMTILRADPHFSIVVGDPNKSRFHYSII